jgi:hypothetical protein
MRYIYQQRMELAAVLTCNIKSSGLSVGCGAPGQEKRINYVHSIDEGIMQSKFEQSITTCRVYLENSY